MIGEAAAASMPASARSQSLGDLLAVLISVDADGQGR